MPSFVIATALLCYLYHLHTLRTYSILLILRMTLYGTLWRFIPLTPLDQTVRKLHTIRHEAH